MNPLQSPIGGSASVANSATTRSSSIVLPWEYDCSLPNSESNSKSNSGAHSFAAFLGSDDNLFTGLYASVTKALRTVFLSSDGANSPLREVLLHWRHSSSSEHRVAEVVDALLSISYDDISPLSAAVHSFMLYASSSQNLTHTERRLCTVLKDELYSNFSVLSLSPSRRPTFPPDSAGNLPCVKLIGTEFSCLRRPEPPRLLLIYSRTYPRSPDSPETLTFIDVYDTITHKLEALLKTNCISGSILSASIDFNLKVFACVAASGGPRTRDVPMFSKESASGCNSSAAYWTYQSVSASAIVQTSLAHCVDTSPSHGDNKSDNLRVDVSNLPPSACDFANSDEASLARSESGRNHAWQYLDYRTFVWSFRNLDSKASPAHISPLGNSDDLQLEWYDDECIFVKSCNIVTVENSAPILLRLRQENFVQCGKLGSRVEKLLRLATDKETRECVRVSVPTLLLDQLFLDKPPPNRVLPCPLDSAPDGVIASRVLFYQWFPSEFQLLVVSVLKSEKAYRAYDAAMREMQTPEFVSLAAIVRLFRFEASSKKGRPVLEQLLSDVISIEWPNFAMQELSKRALAHHAAAVAAAPSRSASSDGSFTPLSPGPSTPAAIPAKFAAPMCVYPLSIHVHGFISFFFTHVLLLAETLPTSPSAGFRLVYVFKNMICFRLM